MTAATTENPGGTRTPRRIIGIISGLLIGVFLSALDTMIMASALRTIADELNGITLQAWVTTAYLLTATVTTPLYGKLSDLFGRKWLYLLALAVFVGGSLLCAIAGSMYELAVYRGVQGLGAGGLMSLALAVLADLLPPAQRVRAQANLGIVFGVASVSGPVVGGFFAGVDSLAGVAGWRWIFLINLPIGLVALLLVGALFTAPAVSRRSRRIDYAGALLLVAGLVPLLVVIERGRDWGWVSVPALTAYGMGVSSLVVFVAVQRRRGDDALLPPRLFHIRLFRLVNVVNFIGGVGTFTGLTFLPLYLQIGNGMSPTAAGLMLLPQSVATTVGARLSGPLVERTGRYRDLLGAGLAVMAVSYLAIALFDNRTPLWMVGGVVLVMGLGLGVFMQVVLIAMQDSVPPRHIGVASGLYGFSRQMGGAIGVAVLLSVLFALVPGRVSAAYESARRDPGFRAAATDPAVLADPASRATLARLEAGTAGRQLADTSFLGTIDDRVARPLRDGITGGITTVFGITAVITALAACLTRLIAPAPVSRPGAGGRRGRAGRTRPPG